MSYLANSRPGLVRRTHTLATMVLLFCSICSSLAFPDQFELNSFLYNAPPKTFEADFFNPRMKLQNDDEYTRFRARESPMASSGMYVSQNHKYLAKTPEHDHHFQTILRQQEAATIKDPGQAAMVASDQMDLKNRGVRNSLQTSDDDVYELESAPVERHMKSTPFRSRSERYQPLEEPSEESNMELPVSVSFESNIDHSYEPKQHEKRHPRAYAKLMAEDGEPMEPQWNSENSRPRQRRPESHSRPYNPPSEQVAAHHNMHFSMGSVSNDESAAAAPAYHRGRPGARGHRSKHHSFAFHPQHHHKPYSQMSASDNYQPEHKPRHYHSQSDEFRNVNYGSSPALHEQSLQSHERELFGSPPVPGSKYDTANKASPMESSWLDMGAYSSGKGAFGWYSDTPVGGAQVHKK